MVLVVLVVLEVERQSAVQTMPPLSLTGTDDLEPTPRPHTLVPDSKAMLQLLFPEVAEMDQTEDDHPHMHAPAATLNSELLRIANVATGTSNGYGVPVQPIVESDHDAEADVAKMLAGQMMPSFSQTILAPATPQSA
jgi:hypothetical protein